MRRIGAILAAIGLLAGPAQAQQISTLPSASSITDADLFYVVQGYSVPGTGTGRKATGSLFRSFITANMGTILDGQLGAVRGSIAVRGATAWGGLAPGTSGYVLTSNGTGADPTYQAVPGGSLAALSDVTLSTPTNGQALVYNTGSSKWVNQTITATPGGSSGQLQYNNAGSFAGMTAMSGDATLNTGTGALTLAASGASAGSYGSSTQALTGTVDAKGRLTAVSATTITPALASLPTSVRERTLRWSFAGATAIAASIPVGAEIDETNGLAFPANPTWSSQCYANPTASMDFVLKTKVSGTLTTVGNITVGTSGTVTASPTWSPGTIAKGTTIFIVSPASVDTTANGCALAVTGTVQ